MLFQWLYIQQCLCKSVQIYCFSVMDKFFYFNLSLNLKHDYSIPLQLSQHCLHGSFLHLFHFILILKYFLYKNTKYQTQQTIM